MKGVSSRREITTEDARYWPGIRDQRLYSVEEVKRFLAKIEIRGPDECWPWTSAVASTRKNNPDGYGVVTIRRKLQYAHRMSLELALGESLSFPLPLACHTCDYGICCNPRHLYAGTHASNSEDKYARGRNSAKGKERRQKILVFLSDHATSNGGHGPTLLEISEALGIKGRLVRRSLDQLIESGDVHQEVRKTSYRAVGDPPE